MSLFSCVVVLAVAVIVGWLLFPLRLPVRSEVSILEGKRILVTGASQVFIYALFEFVCKL